MNVPGERSGTWIETQMLQTNNKKGISPKRFNKFVIRGVLDLDGDRHKKETSYIISPLIVNTVTGDDYQGDRTNNLSFKAPPALGTYQVTN